jgi:predicted acetyltransferase
MLELKPLQAGDEAAFMQGVKDWEGEELYWHSFTWKPGMPFAEMLTVLRKEEKGEDLKPGRVPHTMFYGFVDGEIIGRVSVRHSLNEELSRRGGHMGYAVAPKFRRRGYASAMVCAVIPKLKELRLARIMVTCAEENVPSWKIIEAIGGSKFEKFWDEEEKEWIRVYWVDLK